jgi:hypothetical protein
MKRGYQNDLTEVCTPTNFEYASTAESDEFEQENRG